MKKLVCSLKPVSKALVGGAWAAVTFFAASHRLPLPTWSGAVFAAAGGYFFVWLFKNEGC